jgi:hypothetical protein
MYRFTIRWTYYGEQRVTEYFKPIAWEIGLVALWRTAETGLYGSSPATVSVEVIA